MAGAPMSVTTRMLAGLLALAAMIGFAGPTQAQPSQEWTWCANKETPPDLGINGCTTVIQSGKEPNRNLAIAFHNRAVAYYAKGEHDRAIQDYDQAIQLNPTLVDAFNNRGLAYYAKGQHDRAIQDYDQADQA